MIALRSFDALGGADHGWLQTRHHFSFADYFDPRRMGWGRLRVLNDDLIAARSGFPMHPHRDMEIITYVREGAITHEDSSGGFGRTGAGDVQVMSAGTGIHHSEWNREDENTRLYQIWIVPERPGGTPRWDTRPFPKADRAGRFVPLASGLDDDILAGALPIGTSGRVLGATIPAGTTLNWTPTPGNLAYLVADKAPIVVNGVHAAPGDGLAIRDEKALSIAAEGDAEVILIDVPE